MGPVDDSPRSRTVPRPLTVGMVLDDTLDRPDGVQQHVLTLGTWLSGEGHTVHYLAPQTSRGDLERLHVLGSSAQVRFNGNRLSTPVPARVPRLEAALAHGPFDVLNVAMPYSPFMSGRLIARAAPGTAVVGTFHIVPASPVVTVGGAALGLLQRRRLRRLDEVVAVSEPARDFARSAFGVDAFVVPNPVDVRQFADAAPRPDGRPDGPVRVVFLGRLVERKGPEHLLRAVDVLHHEGLCRSPFRVVVAGRGPLLDRLRRFVAERGLGGVVELPGFVAEADKARLLASGDVVTLPSTGGESFGISVVEALAAARGVVLAGDNPGYRTVMGPLTDQLVDPADTGAFARTLAAWIDAPARRAEAAVRQRAQAWTFDIGTVGPQMVAAYRRAVGRRVATEGVPTPLR